MSKASETKANGKHDRFGRIIEENGERQGKLYSTFQNCLFFRVVLKQATVSKLIEDEHSVKGVEYRVGEAGESTSQVFAPLTIVCDGCFSRLRKSLSSSKVGLCTVMYLESF